MDKLKLAGIFMLIVILATLITIGATWVEAKIIVWLATKLGIKVAFNIVFFIMLVWNFFLSSSLKNVSTKND